MKKWLVLSVLLLTSRLLWAGPEATLVVFNENDPASVNLATTYAEQRKIPLSHLIALSTPTTEEITRVEYEATIARPLRRTLIGRGWWKVARPEQTDQWQKVEASKIRYIVLMRGIPLKIAHTNDPWPGEPRLSLPKHLETNAAAVDSELARLGLGGAQIRGVIDNPYYLALEPIRRANHPGLLLVARLDGPTPEIVERMIRDSLAAEQTGLWGFAYVDSRNLQSGGHLMGDQWLRQIAQDLMQAGFPCIHEDTPELFPQPYPMREAALYFGWYTHAVAGPFRQNDFAFRPGAVAVHIHSFSASTVRDASQAWVGPLLAKGAAATLGNVYEPYLSLSPDLSIFEQRLLKGATFGEAAYASQRALSWMTTFVGDPLYRPYKVREPAAQGATLPYAIYRKGAHLWFNRRRPEAETLLTKEAARLKSGILMEGLAILQLQSGQKEGALRSLETARTLYRDREDQLRCVLHTLALLHAKGDKKAVLTLARREIRRHPSATATPLLQAIVHRLDPPPQPSLQPASAAPAGSTR